MEGNVHGALAAREHQSSSPASTDVQGMDGDESTSGERRLTRSYAAQALAVTLVDWERVGSEVAGGAPMSPQDSGGRTQHSQETNHIDLKTAVDRVSALFMVRLAAIWDAPLTAQSEGEAPGDEDSSNGEDSGREDPLVRYYYSDFSTTTVCQQTLQSGAPWPFLGRRGSGGDDDDGRTLKASSSELERQVRQYIATILSRYNPDLPYHNYKHAYHVVLSVNKLLDLMLRRQDRDGSDPDASHVTVPPLFGLRRDAHLQLALLFAALVHDVDHKGVTNQQLVREANPLALRYNDTSVQENNSLTTAFQMLLEDEYALLRACMFPAIDDESANLVGSVPTSMDDGSFQRFRSLVINLVLSTDIASPERSQLGKSVFKEAFRPSTHRGADQAAGDGQVHNSSKRRNSATGRRGSLTSEISMPRIARNGNDRCHPRRRSSHTSACSIRSDVTSDSAARMMKGIGLSNAPGASPASNLPSPAKHTRRGSASSDYDSVAFLHRRAARTSRPRGPRRRLSNDTSVDSYWTENGMDSIVMLKSGNKNIQKPTERTYTRKHSHHDSFSASSLDFTESASMLSSPSHSTGRVPCTFYSLSKQTSLLPSLAAMTPPDDQNPTRPRRCRISRRWSTEMSGQSLQQVGNHSIDMQNSSSRVGATNRTQVSRLVHEYYGYGDCGGGVGDGNSSLGESDDNDDNSSLSLTPPSSEDEMDGVVITGLTMSSSSLHGNLPVGGAIVIARKKKKSDGKSAHGATALPIGAAHQHPIKSWAASRRASTGMSTYARKAGPLNSQSIDENREVHGTHKGSDDVLSGKDGWIHHRRYSLDDGEDSKKRASSGGKRLGIRRSMDLSGEPIERYSSSNHSRLTSQTSQKHYHSERRSSLGAMSTFSGEDGVVRNDYYHDYDEPDELKASVIAELILRVADVGHFFQGYDVMVHGTSQTFRELLRAHELGRGADPRPSWFDNQVRIMEGYLLPLARQLEGTGVLSRPLMQPTHHGRRIEGTEERGGLGFSLVRSIESNYDQWMRQGFEVVASLIQESASR